MFAISDWNIELGTGSGTKNTQLTRKIRDNVRLCVPLTLLSGALFYQREQESV